MRLALAQMAPGADVDANLEAIRRLVGQAAARGAQLVLLPEEAMLGIESPEREVFERTVRQRWQGVVEALKALAAEHGLAIVAGTYEPSDDGRPYNTLVAVDAHGGLLGTYRKLHLYDAFEHQESERIRPGDGGTVLVEVAGVRVGLSTCYDIRFPELYRALADDGAQLILVPASWYDGPGKARQWETLLAARAIEDTVWVAAADSCAPHAVGRSQLLTPLGEVAARADDAAGETLLVADVDPEEVERVRQTVPSLADRRFARQRLAD